MKNYNMLGGGRISASTNEELVNKMNEDSMFGYRVNVNKYMQETARRCKLQTGAEIRTQNFDIFVEDLTANGFLTPID